MKDGPKQGPRCFRKRNLVWLICLIGLVVFGAFRYSVHRKLDRRIETLRSQGYPMSLLEMDSLYRDSDDRTLENAWPVYLEAFESFAKHDSDVYGPMGHELIAFASAADAREFMRDHRGRSILRFAAVSPELLRTLD